jgi:hypothetical protein
MDGILYFRRVLCALSNDGCHGISGISLEQITSLLWLKDAQFHLILGTIQTVQQQVLYERQEVAATGF